MGYTVLHRKWRPQTFGEVVGQGHVVRALQNALARGRVAQAYLFAGPRGVGKTTVARVLAKAINCESGPSPEPCNGCASCIEIGKGSSLDVVEIDGASNTGVDDIRELRESVQYLPSCGRYKVYIIDEVHMLSLSAFNALLKTLEEPPPHTVFIFATTEPHKIPPTILSRCQRFDFRRIASRRIMEALRRIAEAEGVVVDGGALTYIAKEADGSMRDAQVMLDQVMAFKGDRIEERDVVDLFGLLDRGLIRSAAEAILSKDGKGCIKALERVNESGYDERRFWQDLIGLFRDLLVIKVVQRGEGIVDLPEEERDLWEKRLKGVTLEDLHWILHTLIRGYEEAVRSFSVRLALEVTLLRAVSLPPVMAIQELIERIEDLKRGWKGPGTGIEPSESLSLGEGVGREDLLDFVKGRSLPIYSHLQHLSGLSLEDGRLSIEIERGIHYDRLVERRDELEGICRDFFKKDVKVVIKGIKERDGGDRDGSFIKDVLEIFDGRVYKDTVRRE